MSYQRAWASELTQFDGPVAGSLSPMSTTVRCHPQSYRSRSARKEENEEATGRTLLLALPDKEELISRGEIGTTSVTFMTTSIYMGIYSLKCITFIHAVSLKNVCVRAPF